MHHSVSTRSESDASVSVNWIKKWGRSSMHQCPKSTGSSRAGECISVIRALVQERLSNALARLVQIGKMGVADRTECISWNNWFGRLYPGRRQTNASSEYIRAGSRG
jgi:hypothetical protein